MNKSTLLTIFAALFLVSNLASAYFLGAQEFFGTEIVTLITGALVCKSIEDK